MIHEQPVPEINMQEGIDRSNEYIDFDWSQIENRNYNKNLRTSCLINNENQNENHDYLGITIHSPVETMLIKLVSVLSSANYEMG